MRDGEPIRLDSDTLPSSTASPAIASPYLTAREAAAYLRVSYSTFRKRAIFIKRCPQNNKYRREDLDAFAMSNRPPKPTR
jgi:hypothetical protein